MMWALDLVLHGAEILGAGLLLCGIGVAVGRRLRSMRP